MISVEIMCFLLVVVGSLAMFYYLGFLAGRDAVLKELTMWDRIMNEEEDDTDV